MDSVAELRCLLAATNVHDQLISGGECGLTEITLKRWLRARKVRAGDIVLLLCLLRTQKHAAPENKLSHHEWCLTEFD